MDKNILDKAKSIIDKDIVKVNIKYIDFDGNEKEGIMEVHKEVKNEVLTIFEELKKKKFPNIPNQNNR
jgi:hypothetical protein